MIGDFEDSNVGGGVWKKAWLEWFQEVRREIGSTNMDIKMFYIRSDKQNVTSLK